MLPHSGPNKSSRAALGIAHCNSPNRKCLRHKWPWTEYFNPRRGITNTQDVFFAKVLFTITSAALQNPRDTKNLPQFCLEKCNPIPQIEVPVPRDPLESIAIQFSFFSNLFFPTQAPMTPRYWDRKHHLNDPGLRYIHEYHQYIGDTKPNDNR